MNKYICTNFTLLLLVAASFILSPVLKADLTDPTTETRISFEVKGLENANLLLAYYFGDNQYIKDTIRLDGQGKAVYTSEEGLECGIYLAVAPNHNWFEFIVNEPEISLSTDTTSLIQNMKVKVSEENKIFYGYMNYLGNLRKTADKLSKDIKLLEEGDKKRIKMQEKLDGIDAEVKGERERIIIENKGMLVSTIFRAQEEPQIPENPNPEDSTFAFTYYKSHFFDQIDWSNGCLIRTPILGKKIKQYINKLTIQHPDSVVNCAKYLIPLSMANEEIFKFTVITFINKAAKSKVMCMDKLYVYVGENYYMKDLCPWADSTQLSKITDRVLKLKYNQCGNRAVNLKMEGLENGDVQLYEMPPPFTVVYFWAYDCGHCKKVTPKLKEFYDEYKSKGVNVYAVCIKDDTAQWRDYIEKNGLEDWTHGIDTKRRSNFRIFYDIYSTPVIYLLDPKKKILAKRLDIAGLKQFIDHELEIMEKDSN